jgi:hypothetical protein
MSRPSDVSFSVADYLSLVASKIPPALISPEALDAIREFAVRVPGPSTTFFGFESRLGVPAATADFLVCLHPEPDHGRALLAGLEPGFPSSTSDEGPWQQVRTFAQQWADPGSPLYDRVDNVWLEFDLADASEADPLPSFFFGCSDRVRSSAPEADLHWITEQALPTLQAAAFSPKVGERILEAIRALPPEAFVFQIGAMLARPSRAVRLCIRGINGWQIPEYLEAIGWPGSTQELAVPFSEIAPLADRIDLDIDIDEDGVLPKIGLEWYLYSHLRIDPRWDTFLQWLVERGLSTPEKSRALYDYPGAQHERSKAVVWPPYLHGLAAAEGPKIISTVIRSVHHIKVVYHPQTGLEAKAYLAVAHKLLDTAPFLSGQQPLPQVRLAPVPEFQAGA